MSNPHTHQSLLSMDEQHVRESLARLLTKAGGDVCFHEIERISGESEHDCSAHRVVLTTRPRASSPPSGKLVERFPILLRSEKPPTAQPISNR